MNVENYLIEADKAFKIWKKIPFKDRQKLLINLASILKSRAEEYGIIITKEMNKPITQSITEIKKSAGMIEYYATLENILQPEVIPTEFDISEVHYEPMGVILGVMPWNFPFWQVLRFAVPSILAGNVVVLKHASICFGSGNKIEELFLEAGFPRGVFKNLEIGHQEVATILENPIVKGVSLTGSGGAGGQVAALAGKNIKKSLLELGGSDAYIVLDDADVEKAAKEGPKGKFQNAGQVCNGSKRFIILESIKDRFMPIFIDEVKTYVPGDPMDKETKISMMARKDLADDLEAQYKKALDHGAEIILPLERISGLAFNPGVILVQAGNPILREELFGPLAMVMIAQDDEDCLQLANDIPFGLANSIWTSNKERAQFFIDNLESGTVSLNKATSSDTRLPFGGVKQSGYGVELSTHALKEFTVTKTIVGFL